MNAEIRVETPAHVATRVTRLLRTIGGASPAGMSTTSIARASGMNRSTAHRLLSSLASDGFVDRDLSTGMWFLGPEVYLLGALAAERYDIRDMAAERLRVLAERSGETAHLSARRGNETVCIAQREGSFPLRSFVLREGSRFPLGVASAGMVILAFLPPREVSGYLSRGHLQRDLGERYSESEVLRRVEATRAAGYSLNPGMILEGSWGIGAAVFDSDGRPAWALSLTGVELRFRDRHRQLGALLLEEAHVLTQSLRT